MGRKGKDGEVMIMQPAGFHQVSQTPMVHAPPPDAKFPPNSVVVEPGHAYGMPIPNVGGHMLPMGQGGGVGVGHVMSMHPIPGQPMPSARVKDDDGEKLDEQNMPQAGGPNMAQMGGMYPMAGAFMAAPAGAHMGHMAGPGMYQMGSGHMRQMGSGQMGQMGSGHMGQMGSGQMSQMGSGQMSQMGSGQMGQMGQMGMGPPQARSINRERDGSGANSNLPMIASTMAGGALLGGAAAAAASKRDSKNEKKKKKSGGDGVPPAAPALERKEAKASDAQPGTGGEAGQGTEHKPEEQGQWVIEKHCGVKSMLFALSTACVCAPCIYCCCPLDTRRIWSVKGKKEARIGWRLGCGCCGVC